MQFIITSLCCLLSFTLIAQTKVPAADKRFADLDKTFEKVLKECNAAGFSVAVIEKNKVILEKGYGFSNYEEKVPATASTVYAIGSCTKAFTSSLIGLLEKEGKVQLDKPVTNYLPALRFYNREMDNNITLRDMMCHRTGLPRYDFSWYFFPTASRDTLMQRIQYMKPSAGLREKWQYNNFMFLLQGVVTEKLTGKSWEDNVREKLITPLGMNNTVVTLAEWKNSTNAAVGYGLLKDSVINKLDYYDISGMAPAGSINSTVSDMTNWVKLWINNGKFNGKELLPSSYVKQAISSQMVSGEGLPSKESPDTYMSTYGFGWMLASYRGHYRVEHGGNIDGFSASTCFFPSDSIGIIVLCNQNGSIVPSIVRNLIADRMLGLKKRDWLAELTKAGKEAKMNALKAKKIIVSARKAGTAPSHPATDYMGIYSHPQYGDFELLQRKDSLYAVLGLHTFWLRHYHYDVFELLALNKKTGIDTANPMFKIMFQMNEQGNIITASLPLDPSAEPVIFSRSVNSRELSIDSLVQYTGNYDLLNIAIKIYIKDDKTLFMQVPGQPQYELVPIEKHIFKLKGLNGFTVQFNRNSQGKITELLSIQPNGTFKATKK